mmetsp:Transcript_26043/g.47236  ORF Transcript_26043/g.47236 Transcript_26043/m.47236 type:complete len:216 (-) Transcript_26043:659-1306(-)
MTQSLSITSFTHATNYRHLLELLHKRRSKVLRHPQSLYRNGNGGQTLRLLTRRCELGRALLHRHVIRILRKEVRHGRGVLRLELLHGRLVFIVGHVITEHLLSLGICHGGERIGTAASIGGDADLLARLGLNGEFDLVEVGEILAGGSWEGLHAGEFLVGGDGFDVLNGYVVEGDEEGEFVDGHVFEHTFGITLEAFSKRLGRVLISIVGDKSDM